MYSMNEEICISLNFKVVEFNEHYCVVKYDNDRAFKLYSRDEDYKKIERYFKTLNV